MKFQKFLENQHKNYAQVEKWGCSPFLVKRQMELSRKQKKWNDLVDTSVTLSQNIFQVGFFVKRVIYL